MSASILQWFASNDERAMWRLQSRNDIDAFAQLVNRWQKPIRALCCRMTGDIHRAEDLAQETFSRVFAKRADYRPTARFSTFIWRIALNLCYDELRRRQRHGEVPLTQAGEETGGEDHVAVLACESPSPDDALMLRERADRVREALLFLDEPCRAVVVLRHYENLKFREIAEVLDIPEGTVKTRMTRALDELGRHFSRHNSLKESI
jgi:RNA polymerase sigma-70 factor, ECF subfamily